MSSVHHGNGIGSYTTAFNCINKAQNEICKFRLQTNQIKVLAMEQWLNQQTETFNVFKCEGIVTICRKNVLHETSSTIMGKIVKYDSFLYDC